jgi:hypothetical protein
MLTLLFVDVVPAKLLPIGDLTVGVFRFMAEVRTALFKWDVCLSFAVGLYKEKI